MRVILESKAALETLGTDAGFAVQSRSKSFIAACLLYVAAFRTNKTTESVKAFLSQDIPYYLIKQLKREELLWVLDSPAQNTHKKILLDMISK